MDLFKTKTDFMDYIFSCQWQEDVPWYFIKPYPIGRYSLSDLIGYLQYLSRDELLALLSDITFRTEKLELEKLSQEYSQESSFELFEERLQDYNLETYAITNYPVAEFVFNWISDNIQKNSTDRTTANSESTHDEELNLPSELDTDRARKYFADLENLKLIKIAGNEFEWYGTKGELALCAVLMCEKLGIENKFQTFERLFKVKYLAQYYYKAVNVFGTFGKREKKIREIFEH